jgi:protein-tyrosine sulfotransferase
MNEHVEAAVRLCAKDPDTAYFTSYLAELFPRAKFILMARDARAVVYSLLKQYGEPLSAANANKYMQTWDSFYERAVEQCEQVGSSACLVLKYEALIVSPERVMRRVASFLNLTWTTNFMRHEAFIDTKIRVSETEWSTGQIKKKLYKSSLLAWVDKVAYPQSKNGKRINNVGQEVVSMMSRLGYRLDVKNYDYLKE